MKYYPHFIVEPFVDGSDGPYDRWGAAETVDTRRQAARLVHRLLYEPGGKVKAVRVYRTYGSRTELELTAYLGRYGELVYDLEEYVL